MLYFLGPIATQGPPGRSPGPPGGGLKGGNHRICPECLNSCIRIALFSYKNHPVQTPRAAAVFGEHSRGNGPISAGFRNTIEDPGSKAAKVTCFTVHFGTGFRGGADPATLSRIRPCRALWPANGATRRKSRRENTVLSDRRLRRSRARGAVRCRTRHASWGSGASARGLCVNLRDI